MPERDYLEPSVSARLEEPLDPARVKTREGGGGRELSYIEAHDAIRTANEIFGFGGWDYQVKELVPIPEVKFTGRDDKKGTHVGYRAVVEVRVALAGPGMVTFSDVGYGDASEYTQKASVTAHELAAKEAVSDGIKRCLKNFGDQFGLGLYKKEERASGRRRTQEEPTGEDVF